MYFIRQKMGHLFEHRCFTALSEKKVPKSAETAELLFRLPLNSSPDFPVRTERSVQTDRIAT